jgi:aspartate-semialdehyde dehydrogenase
MSRPYTLPRAMLRCSFASGSELQKIPVAVLGACSSIGQRLVEILSSHPWFEIVQLTSCEKSVGKPYSEAVHWLLPTEIPIHVRSMVVTDHQKQSKARFAFSVLEGLLESVSLSFKKKVSLDEVRRAFIEFRPSKEVQALPSACKRVSHFFDEQDAPQPKFHKYLEGGMAVSVGALRPSALLDYKFLVLSHNAIRGAAGGLVQITELVSQFIAK